MAIPELMNLKSEEPPPPPKPTPPRDEAQPAAPEVTLEQEIETLREALIQASPVMRKNQTRRADSHALRRALELIDGRDGEGLKTKLPRLAIFTEQYRTAGTGSPLNLAIRNIADMFRKADSADKLISGRDMQDSMFDLDGGLTNEYIAEIAAEAFGKRRDKPIEVPMPEETTFLRETMTTNHLQLKAPDINRVASDGFQKALQKIAEDGDLTAKLPHLAALVARYSDTQKTPYCKREEILRRIVEAVRRTDADNTWFSFDMSDQVIAENVLQAFGSYYKESLGRACPR